MRALRQGADTHCATCPAPIRVRLMGKHVDTRPHCHTVLLDHEPQLRSRARTADQEALGLLAAGSPHELELLFGLDTFGGRNDPKLPPEICDGTNNRGAIAATRHFPHERLVDLDLVEGK